MTGKFLCEPAGCAVCSSYTTHPTHRPRQRLVSHSLLHSRSVSIIPAAERYCSPFHGWFLSRFFIVRVSLEVGSFREESPGHVAFSGIDHTASRLTVNCWYHTRNNEMMQLLDVVVDNTGGWKPLSSWILCHSCVLGVIMAGMGHQYFCAFVFTQSLSYCSISSCLCCIYAVFSSYCVFSLICKLIWFYS